MKLTARFVVLCSFAAVSFAPQSSQASLRQISPNSKKTLSVRTSASAPSRKAKAAESEHRAEMPADHHGEEHHAGGGDGGTRFGAGFTTLNTGLANFPAFSGTFQFGSASSVQGLFGIDGTSGTFRFSFGGIYRHTLAGTQTTGFHVGGGLVLSTVAAGAATTAFRVTLAPLAGFHYQVPHAPVQLSLDGGPMLTLLDGNADFQVGAGSQLLGLSIHYLF
jgi:hypothetical protein